MAEANSPIENQELYAAYETRSINVPQAQNFNTPAMDGSLQQFLADNLGSYVVVEFLVGTQILVQKAGILYALGSSILTLFEEISETFVTCDIYSVKFVTFYLPGHRPWQLSNPLFSQSGVGNSNLFPGGIPLQSAMPAIPTPQWSGSAQMPWTGSAQGGMTTPSMGATQGSGFTPTSDTGSSQGMWNDSTQGMTAPQGSPNLRPPAFSRPQ